MHYKIFSIELLNMHGTKVLIVIELVSRRFDLCQFKKKVTKQKYLYNVFFVVNFQ